MPTPEQPSKKHLPENQDQQPAKDSAILKLDHSDLVSSPAVDRTLEKNFDDLISRPTGNTKQEQADAIGYLRKRHDEPEVAYKLAEMMMTSAFGKIRGLAEIALVGTNDKIGKDLLRSEHLIREMCTGDSKFGEDSSNIDQIISDLRQVREHPLVSARLIEVLTNGSYGAHHAATVLQGTTDKNTQRILKETLQTVLANDNFVTCQREQMWQLPLALKYNSDPEVQTLIINSLRKENDIYGTNNFRGSAARALGGINTQEAKDLLLESVLELYQGWPLRRGITEALKEQMSADATIKDKLLPLIEGSFAKTAWHVAGEHSDSKFGQLVKFLGYRKRNKEQIHNIRVQVALTLQEKEPELAKVVFNDALNGQRESFYSNCHFFAANDALEAINDLEKAA